MSRVRISGWRDGFDPVALMRLLRAQTGLTHRQAESFLKSVMNDKVQEIELAGGQGFVEKATAINVRCELLEEQGAEQEFSAFFKLGHHLHAEVCEKHPVRQLKEKLAAANATIAQLTAERYEYIRQGPERRCSSLYSARPIQDGGMVLKHGDALDAAIDAARREVGDGD